MAWVLTNVTIAYIDLKNDTIKSTFTELKEDRMSKMEDLFSILDKFENKVRLIFQKAILLILTHFKGI